MREMLGSVRRAVRRREVVYLVGAAGYPNYGDEAIARAWLRHLARTHPDAEVWLDCHTPGAAALLFRGDHPRLRTTDFLWRMCWDAPSEDPEAVAEHVTACLADPARAPAAPAARGTTSVRSCGSRERAIAAAPAPDTPSTAL